MNNVTLNPAPLAPVVPKSGLVGKRYSNDDATTTGAGLGQNTSGSGAFNWGSFLSDLLKSGSSIIGSIWGKDSQYTAMAYQSMYEQEQKTKIFFQTDIGIEPYLSGRYYFGEIHIVLIYMPAQLIECIIAPCNKALCALLKIIVMRSGNYNIHPLTAR